MRSARDEGVCIIDQSVRLLTASIAARPYRDKSVYCLLGAFTCVESARLVCVALAALRWSRASRA
jgi:hypothetical protein